MKSSFSDRLQIAALSPPGITGVIGLTLCPGKKDPGRDWDRDLDIDLTVIEQWGAEVVITLVEPHELELLHVLSLPNAVARHGMRWVHLPIHDVSTPDHRQRLSTFPTMVITYPPARPLPASEPASKASFVNH